MLQPHLILTPSVSIWTNGDSLIFDRKFYDGISLYVKLWPGTVSCIMSTSDSNLPDFGFITKRQNELPFQCVLLAKDEIISNKHLKDGAIVLASGDSFKQFHVSKLCKRLDIKCVYLIEYIPETRYQIAALSTNNPIVKFRRFLYIWLGEKKRLSAFSIADGIQMNGTAAYYEYNSFSNHLLYFDTRVYKNLIINNDDLDLRLKYLTKDKPLRLVFSGRLISAKGADHLVKMALQLKMRKINFSLTIYGAGELKDEMIEFINQHQLNNNVLIAGTVDFYNELIPNLKEKFDLFICLHRQSDPSCTYLETFSCGLPIVGYKNRAFAGLLELMDIGWGAELNNINEIVDIIENINLNRKQIIKKAKNSIKLANQHDFETTFQNRIDHLLQSIK